MIASVGQHRTSSSVARRRLERPQWTRETAGVGPATDSNASTFSLAPFIEDVRAVEPVAGRPFDVDQLPDGRTTLVFRVLEGRSADVCVAGPRTRASFKHSTGVTRALILRFKPGWSSPLLGVAANVLTDRIILLEDIWGPSGRDLCDELVEAPSLPDAIERLTRALHRRKTFESASGRLARHALRLLEGGEVRVERVAERLGVTPRHLRRVFKENVGVGPKEFARTLRLQRALQSAATSKDWARIASHAGYYDQAHLIADFKHLIGLTPGAYSKRAAQRQSAARASVP